MKTQRALSSALRALQSCAAWWLLLMAGTLRSADHDTAARKKERQPQLQLPAARIAAVAAAHEDPLRGMRAEAERWWDRIVAGDRPIPDIPLPAWMAEALKRRPPLQWPAGDDYAAWAAFLAHPNFRDPQTVLQHLATPAAKAYAPVVTPWLSADSKEIRRVAMETLRSMGGPETARELAAALQKEPRLSGEKITLLHELAPQESAALIKELVSRRPVMSGDDIADAVGKTQDARLAEILVPFLISENRWTRSAALTNLRTLGTWHAVAAALDVLNRDDDYVPEALQIIGELGDHRLHPLLAEYLENRTDRVARAAATAAARAGMHSLAPRMAELLSLTDDDSLQTGLMEALALLQAREFIPQIAERLSIEATAEAALAALTRLHATEAIPQITALRDRTKNPVVQAACVRALLSLRALNRGEAVRALTFLLDREDGGSRFAADEKITRELVRLDAVESTPAILRAAGKSGYRIDGYCPLLKLLYDMGVSSQTAMLAEILATGDADMRRGCLMYLHNYKVAECAPFIVSVMQSDALWEVRDHAIRALLYAGDPDSFRALAEFLLQAEPLSLKSTALQTLAYAEQQGKRLPAEAVRAVRLFVTGPNVPEEQKCSAVYLLAASAPGRETDHLLLGLLTAKPPVSSSLWEAIARSFSAEAPQEAAAALAAMLHDPDGWKHYNHNYTALDGLKRMKAKEFAEDVAAVVQRAEPANYASPYALDVLWAFGDRRYWDRMGMSIMSQARSEEEAATLLPRLQDRNVTDALAQMEGFRMTRHLHRFIEVTLYDRDRRAAVMFAARMLYADTPELNTALSWLGHRAEAERPELPADREQAKEIVRAIHRVRQDTPMGHGGFRLTAKETGALMAEIIGAVSWSWRDAEWLAEMAADLKRDPASSDKAAGVLALAEAARAQHPLQVALRAALWTLAALPVLWLLVLLAYPWSRLAQTMVWTRWTRRWLGLGCIGPIVLGIPRLRERLWGPFRESLVPPGEVVSFDEWTFFDAVRVTPASGGGALPALRVFSGFRGVVVLCGESGLGKTTLLQALAGQSPQPVALLRAAECGEGLLAALQARLPRFAQKDTAFLRALVRRRSPDIFVDAVHEALPEVRTRLTEEVNSLPGAGILLTTQPVAGWTPPQHAAAWQLEPLRAQDIAPFLLKQGTAAVEAAGAGAGSLAERQRAFAARTAAFLDHLENLPPESPEAAALRRMLGNPMEAVLAAELLAAGQTPDPNRLLEQRMEHLEDDYTAQCGEKFPAAAFAGHLRSWRASGAPLLRMDVFTGVAAFLAKHRLLRKSAGGIESWRFRHDKVMEWFLRAGGA